MMASRAFALACHLGEKRAKEGLNPPVAQLTPFYWYRLRKRSALSRQPTYCVPLPAEGNLAADSAAKIPVIVGASPFLAVIRPSAFIVRDKAPESGANLAR
jgi:hypothetical protein